MRLKENLSDIRTRWLTLGTLAFSALALIGVALAITTITVSQVSETTSLTTLATVFILLGSIGTLIGALALNHRSKITRR
ncbi:hypothetical protein [Microbacterium oxydans]|uniref:hypothetical protein n=1 Tax=Microbacterium oxydans TaxID=82380 RepID=UPI0022B14C75|nr:hypothetical protein [Microbacterium oxydans]MCZ4302425.1 hypothetical protein [Microbacterium oxydans]